MVGTSRQSTTQNVLENDAWSHARCQYRCSARTAKGPGGRASSLTDLNNQSIKVLARHVKPLLDVGMGKIPHLYAGLCYDSQFPENAGDPKCPACRLLAEWRRPL